MLLDLPYGKRSVQIRVPGHARVVSPPVTASVKDAKVEIRRAMEHPIGCPPLRQLAQGKSDAVVVINDVTRPAPTALMVREILSELGVAGINYDKVTLLIATGNHRGSSSKEIIEMVGQDLFSKLRILNHDCQDDSNLIYLGKTDAGLPIWANSRVAEASVKVITGIITPHHGAGYSGGRKSIVPGVAGLQTLKIHHSFPIRQYEPMLGKMKGNPFHEEAVKGARIVGVDFIVNAVKNPRGEIVRVVAGDLEAAHETGVVSCQQNWLVSFDQRYDIVIVTPGGYPYDIDLHQSQKALSVAEMVTREGGTIVLISECSEGIGKFADWLKTAKSPKEVIDRFKKEGFTADQSSKAFMCARALERFKIVVACSGIDAGDLEDMFFSYASSPQAAIDMALASAGSGSSVVVVPVASHCIPALIAGSHPEK